jgi:signal transduction histidine kinase
MKKRLGINYDVLFHALPGHYMVLVNNAPDYTIIEASDSLCALIGRTRDQILEKSFQDVYPVSKNKESREGTKALMEAIEQCVTTGTLFDAGVVRYDTKDESGKFVRRLWAMEVYPLMKDGKVTGVILSTDDVTERYDADDYARQRLKHLEHLVEINKSKDEFISIASHQLRTPATGVKQYLAMLRDGLFGEMTEQQCEILERAYESNERQLRIVTDLLKVAQVDSGKVVLRKEVTNINQLVHYLIRDNMDMFKRRNQQLVFQPLDTKVEADIDSEIVRMVVENIIDNASKYTEEGKSIEVTITDDEAKVKIAVADEGVGIPKDMQRELFKKFVRIDNELSMKVGGTGLGLYWAKRSIDMHGGDIVYRENAPHGSVFEIILPKQ